MPMHNHAASPRLRGTSAQDKETPRGATVGCAKSCSERQRSVHHGGDDLPRGHDAERVAVVLRARESVVLHANGTDPHPPHRVLPGHTRSYPVIYLSRIVVFLQHYALGS